ncbi:MAG: aspartate kinase [Mucinivorans sp.]
MKTLKFGGTSVGSPKNMRGVAQIISNEQATLTVLSAMSGTTDALVAICEAAAKGDEKTIAQKLKMLLGKYNDCVYGLLGDPYPALERVKESMDIIRTQADDFEKVTSPKVIVSQGELLTTAIFTMFLLQEGVKAELLHAPDFMHTDEQGKVVLYHLDALKERIEPGVHYVTQGFICTNAQGQIDNLGRGGSDYSAALMGVAIGAAEVQIWTDIDGMHNGDPRIVEGTRPIRRMSFDEAAELAYFGAKILHPSTIMPCKEAGVDVRLKNSMAPDAPGTLISGADEAAMNYHAVAAKDGITLIRITSARMLMAYGFLRRVFEVFERQRTPIDMITTSEVAVSLTIDNTTNLDKIVRDLSDFGTIEVEQDNSIVCVVGRMDYDHAGLASRIFKSVENVPIKMISYGASHRSLSLLISTVNKKDALQSLNNQLF